MTKCLGTAFLVLFSGVAAALAVNGPVALNTAFGPDADTRWEIVGGAAEKDGGPISTVEDSILKRPVLACGSVPVNLKGLTDYRDVEFSCLVRLAATPKVTTSYVSVTMAKDPMDSASAGTAVVLHGTYGGDFSLSALGKRAFYDLRAYDKIMPVWEDAARIPIERDMAGLPLAQDKWVRLRCQSTKDWIRVWLDDRLVAEQRGKDVVFTHGIIGILLTPGARLADVKIRRICAADNMLDGAYETVALDGYVRDRALVGKAAIGDGSLPFGQRVEIEGVPFCFASREGEEAPDHLDISRSLLRQGSMEGYFGTYPYRFAGALVVDPARIVLRFPNGLYDALYVIAAFDGEKDRIPLLTASFCRSTDAAGNNGFGGGFAQFFEGEVPALSAHMSADATPLPVKLDNGKSVNLWLVKIPLDPAKLASFVDESIIDMELTKQVKLYRSYPDPFTYGWHQGGLPSGVHVYAVTLHRPAVEMRLEPARFGHVWTDPEVPTYGVELSNRSDKASVVKLVMETVSHDGLEKLVQTNTVSVAPGQQAKSTFSPPAKKNGYHEIRVTMTDTNNGAAWTEKRSFVRLAPDTRAPFWEPGKGTMFGYWSYGGGHNTPPNEEVVRLMHLAGARAAIGQPPTNSPAYPLFTQWKMKAGANPWPITPQWSWAATDKVDQVKYDAYKTNAVDLIVRKTPGFNGEFVGLFPEPHISRDLTCGNPPDYWGEPPYVMNPAETNALWCHFNTAKAAAEGLRAAEPDVKILIPHGDPLFVIPLLRAGFPTNLIDGSGLDMIGFERLPEQQIAQMSMHRLYFLKEEYKRAGIKDPLLWYIEGIFTPTEPGACTWDEQAQIYHRWSLLSMAYGVDRFYSGWFAFDCGNYYGAEHYGGCGIQRRVPYADPKPGYAHYATMTRMLDQAQFEKWLPTGSLSVYCLKFTRPAGGPVYALWTIRGKRPVSLMLEKDATVTVTDSMDNDAAVTSTNGMAALTVGPDPVYVTGAGDVTNMVLGVPDHSGAVAESRGREQLTWDTGPAVRRPPVAKEIAVADFGDGSWTLTSERNDVYENNNYDVSRYPGKMSSRVVTDDGQQAPSLAIHLEPQDKERKLMPWYAVLKPKKPVVIPGKSIALGLWVKASSDWGRVVYCLQDAKGENWISIGTKDQWNCNDPHSWSFFNFDGWRYVRFEMPANAAYDSFREAGSTWWGHSGPKGDGIVDLPLRLESVIVERRTHAMYVNDPQPTNPDDVLLGRLVAEYATEFDAMKAAVKRSAVRMPIPKTAAGMANPITEMTANELAATSIDGVKMPDWGYDGTSCHVLFKEVPNAAAYQVWGAAYADGRGAVTLGAMPKSGGRVWGLRPARKLYLWVTYTETVETGKAARQSKPSQSLEIELVDAFGMK